MSVPTPNPISTSNAKTRRVLVLGSTGSIGVQALEVIEHLNMLFEQGESSVRYQIVGLAGGSNAELLQSQAAQFAVRDVAICKGNDSLDQSRLNLRTGVDSARRLVEEVPCDLVVGAIVGFAGLDSVLSAIERGIDVALANKETLVAAGSLVIESARKSGARLLPVDSEHAGVWQCLQSISLDPYCPPMETPSGIDRVVLTASGGPFRSRTRQQIVGATLDDALNHPNWAMGAKVTIDSATLMNKALELIEAHWLFGLSADQLGAVIHPQSTVHAMIERSDRSVIAQLGAKDMKAPIQHALSFPARLAGCAPNLDVTQLGQLNFEPIDPDRFPAIGLAMRTIEAGGTAGAILNAANEQAVGAFIQGRLGFGRIDECVAQAMNELPIEPINTLDDVIAADTRAREFVDGLCAPSAGGVR